jgi:tetratricopeptide (TPR) repeat protein
MKHLTGIFLGLTLLSANVVAGSGSSSAFDQSLQAIQSRWAQINYSKDEDKKADAFEQLAQQAEQLSRAYPQRAEAKIWQGIVLSTWAGAKGGLGALSLVEQAKDLFEQSLNIDQQALQGSAYTSLGSLYYQVPGWPIGFGDDDKAKAYLQKALKINPQGIDANYFYADYLIDQGDYRQAQNYLQKALQAPSRPGRPLADQGRRDEIKQRLKLVHDNIAAQADSDSFFN